MEIETHSQLASSNDFVLNLQKIEQKTSLRSFLCYQALQCLTNALFLALYAVQTFSEHETCTVASGREVSQGFNMTFQLGFFMHVAIFIN